MVLAPLLLALAAAAPSPVERDLAGNRIEAFAEVPGQAKPGGPALFCTEDRRWCAEISRDVDLDQSELHVFAGMPGPATPVDIQPLPKSGDEEFGLWPRIVRLTQGAVIIGVTRQVQASYSGGGGSGSDLELIAVAPGASPTTVLTIPFSGSLLIRACFSEKDMRDRRGACHDEYNFDAELTLDPATASGPPRFKLKTQATAYPRGRTRGTDSTTQPPLGKGDLMRSIDKTCSYSRVLTLNEEGDYMPDKPLPDCSDYTAP